ncbi:MAG TPA: thioredoxin domain-containing protein, partial [Candidatus Paceibacterota bacterium]|nr:thioredoxin domain-containing protein [Candidatus Paceibacterota bacterium]
MKSQYVLPITIVVAGLLVAGAVFLVGKVQVPAGQNGTTTSINARQYDPATDHILGNPNAAVKVVEYMDLECPHCKTFEGTMNQVMSYYGNSGNVAWVQRPFPLGSIHSKAPKEAEAAECAAELGGNAAYWRYVEKVFEVTPSNNGLDLAQLPAIAQQVGLDQAAFNTCLNSGKYSSKVTASYNEAIKLGAQGTPFTLIMVGGEAVTLAGNQPYDSMRAAIDAVLQGNPAVQQGGSA